MNEPRLLSLEEIETLTLRFRKNLNHPEHWETLYHDSILDALATARAALKVVEAAKAIDKEFWFDPSVKGAGTCGMCDANMFPEGHPMMGKHVDINGKVCPLLPVHVALEPFRQEEK